MSGHKRKKTQKTADKIGGKIAQKSGLGRRNMPAMLGESPVPTVKEANSRHPGIAAKPQAPIAVPTEQEIATKASVLSGPARNAFDTILIKLAEHLGSPVAARLWLVTPVAQFDTTPLDAILAGEAEAVLAYLESHWGPGPVYA